MPYNGKLGIVINNLVQLSVDVVDDWYDLVDQQDICLTNFQHNGLESLHGCAHMHVANPS